MASKRRKRAVSAARLSADNKALARESNKRLGTKFNTRKKALSSYAVRELKKLQAEGFITGDAQIPPKLAAVKADRKTIKTVKEHGFETRKGRIVIANKPERIRKVQRAIRQGNVPGLTRVGDIGFEHVVIPSQGMNFSDVIERIDNGSLEKMMEPGEAFGYKVFGNHSHHLYSHLDYLRRDLERYQGRQEALRQARKFEQADNLFENFELIRVDGDNYRIPQESDRRRLHPRAARIRKRKAEYRAEKAQVFAMTEAERKRKQRANETPEKREARLTSQRERSRAARANPKRTK